MSVVIDVSMTSSLVMAVAVPFALVACGGSLDATSDAGKAIACVISNGDAGPLAVPCDEEDGWRWPAVDKVHDCAAAACPIGESCVADGVVGVCE